MPPLPPRVAPAARVLPAAMPALVPARLLTVRVAAGLLILAVD